MAKLVRISGDGIGAEHSLGDLCVIGRSPNAQLRLVDRTVSRMHAKITFQDGAHIIEDLDSGRGTSVNGLPVTVSRLRAGDVIKVVDHGFRFEDTPINPIATAEMSLTFGDLTPLPGEGDVAPDTSDEGGRPPGPPQISPVNADRLTAVLKLGRIVAEDDGNPDTLVSRIVSMCLRLFPAAHRALLAVPNRKRMRLEVRSLVIRDGVKQKNFHLSRSVTSRVLSGGEAVRSRETRPLGSEGEVHEVELVAAPVSARGSRLGLITIDRLDAESAFTDDDIQMLRFVAGQLGLALVNANLMAQRAHQFRTEQDLTAAREVQKRFLPRGVPKVPGFSFVAHYDPCRNVGGDLYDFIPFDERRTGVVVGDVSGKGFAAALVMAWVTSQLRLAAHQEARPSDVLTRINESLLETRQDQVFVTVLYGVLDRLTQTMHYCNAGHMPPLVRRASGGPVEVVEETGSLPVGMMPDAEYEEGRIALNEGDVLMLISDGVTEAQNKTGEMYGMDRLIDAVGRGPARASDLASVLLEDLRGFVGGQPQSDDITIVVVGVGGGREDIRVTLPPGSRIDSIADGLSDLLKKA